jgi:3-hydroxyacyl-[acyl-carrier-protein] dehydratase
MRWFLIDRILDLEKGKFCRALKNITLGEDYLEDHFPSFPVVPNSLIIESIAQTGGILVGHLNQFKYKVILAKVEKAIFFRMLRPGDQLIIEAKIVEQRDEGYRVEGWGRVDGKDIVSAKVMFINLMDGNGPWPKENFVFNQKFLSLFELELA